MGVIRFIDTIHCRSRVHCRTCRERDGGRPWRIAMADRFTVPGDVPDWPCPHGLPWGYAPARGLGDTIERVLDATGIGPAAKRIIRRVTGKPCGCAKRRDWLNRLVPYNRD